MFTWSLVGLKLPEAAGAFAQLHPLGPEPRPHLPPEQNTRVDYLINHIVRNYTK